MTKGKFGFYLWLYPTIAFAVCATGGVLVLTLLFAFVLLVEKDEQTSLQVLQALTLTVFYQFIMGIINWTCSLLTAVPFLGTSLKAGVYGFIEGIGQLIIVFICIKAISDVKHGKTISIVWAGNFVNSVYGVVPKYINYEPPSSSQNTTENLDEINLNNSWFCSSCGNKNMGNFCAKCGQRKNIQHKDV